MVGGKKDGEIWLSKIDPEMHVTLWAQPINIQSIVAIFYTQGCSHADHSSLQGGSANRALWKLHFKNILPLMKTHWLTSKIWIK